MLMIYCVNFLSREFITQKFTLFLDFEEDFIIFFNVRKNKKSSGVQIHYKNNFFPHKISQSDNFFFVEKKNQKLLKQVLDREKN